MNAQLAVPAGYRERSGVNSQVIARPGFPQYGVMFTTSNSPSESDFDTDLLLGGLIEDTLKGPAVENRFFRILGGYYFNPVPGGRGTTSQAFGIAQEGAFGIQDRGSAVIGDNWTTLWKTSKHLDENELITETTPAQAGWTFIVEPKYGDKVFPRSKDPLGMWINCPQISEIQVFYKTPTATKQPVELTAIVSEGFVESFEWDFGDGSDLSNTGSNPHTQHTYDRLPGETSKYTVKLKLKGHGSCHSEAKTEVEIPAVPCPTIESFKVQAAAPDPKSVLVTASLDWSGADPETISLDWGDGSAPEPLEGREFSHTFTRPFGNEQSFLISVRLSGPASCGASASAKVSIPGICPAITGVKAEDTAHTEYTQTVSATALMKGDLVAEEYFWNWGDKSPIERTTSPTATHTYQKAKQEERYTIAVQANGPGSCISEGQTVSQVAAGPGCPIIEQLTFKLDPAQNGKVKVHAEIQWKDGNPAQIDFDWGDGSVDKNVNATVATHEYSEPVGIFDTYDVSVTLSGPGDCQSSITERVNIPAKACGKIKAVKLTVANTSTNEQAVKAKLELEGHFDSFVFDWGDGTVESPTANTISDHVYSRGSQDKTYTVKVTASGPGPCKGEATASHSVPRKEKVVPPPPPTDPEIPALCRYLPYIVAFLGALTLGHLALLIVALNTAGSETARAWGASIVSVILLVVAIVIWFRKCQPTRCDWLAIGWVTLLGATIPIFNSVQCSGEQPLIPTIISFVIGAVFGFLWFRSCTAKSRSQVFITYFVLMILAGIIAGLITTPMVLNC